MYLCTRNFDEIITYHDRGKCKKTIDVFYKINFIPALDSRIPNNRIFKQCIQHQRIKTSYLPVTTNVSLRLLCSLQHNLRRV